MEFNYLVEKNRMLNSLGREGRKSCICAGTECGICPLSICKNGRNLSCTTFELEYPIEATEIVRKWAEEHPRKTRKDVLKEAFPNASIDDICALKLGLCSIDDCSNISGDCFKCWNTKIEK